MNVWMVQAIARETDVWTLQDRLCAVVAALKSDQIQLAKVDLYCYYYFTLFFAFFYIVPRIAGEERQKRAIEKEWSHLFFSRLSWLLKQNQFT